MTWRTSLKSPRCGAHLAGHGPRTGLDWPGIGCFSRPVPRLYFKPLKGWFPASTARRGPLRRKRNEFRETQSIPHGISSRLSQWTCSSKRCYAIWSGSQNRVGLLSALFASSGGFSRRLEKQLFQNRCHDHILSYLKHPCLFVLARKSMSPISAAFGLSSQCVLTRPVFSIT